MTQTVIETDLVVKKHGRNSAHLTLDCDWGFQIGDVVHVTIQGTSR